MVKYTILKRENKTSGWSSKTYYVRFYDNGKLTYVNTEQTNKKDADIKAREIVSKMPIKIKVNEASMRNLTLKQYLINKNWLSKTENPLFKDFHSGMSQHSFQIRTSTFKISYLRRLFLKENDPLGGILYYSISTTDIRKFKEKLLTYKMTNNVRNSVIHSLSSVYAYLAKNDKYVQYNPFDSSHIELFAVKDKVKYVFTPYQVYYIFNMDILKSITPVNTTSLKWDNLLKSDYVKAFKFAAYTGMRKSEITALTVGQIEDRVVHINRAFKDALGKSVGLPKNGKARDIVLCDEIYETIIGNLEGKKPTDYVFQSSSNKSIHNNFEMFWDRFRNEVVEAFEINIKEFKFCSHGLRKSLNTNLLKYSSTELKESFIRLYCGWSDAVNTLTPVQEGHYTGYGTEELTKVANAIQKIYVSDVINEVKLQNKDTSSSNWKPSKEEIEKANFMKAVQKIYGSSLIKLIMKDLPKKVSFYNLDNTPELTTQLEKLDNQLRENLIRVNEIKFQELLILTMNSLVNIIA